MGKSYRKTPIFKIAGESDKSSKKQCNKKLRGATREALKHYDPTGDEDLIIPEQEEVMDVWTFNSDGKKYLHDVVEHNYRHFYGGNFEKILWNEFSSMLAQLQEHMA